MTKLARIILVAVLAAITFQTFPTLADAAAPQARLKASEDPTVLWLFAQAADYWRSQGVTIPDYVVSTEDPADNASASVQHWVHPDGTDTPILRIRSNVRYTWRYRDQLAQLALHETVHMGQSTSIAWDPAAYMLRRSWVEGMADGLAFDHLCPFMSRTWGRKVALAECNTFTLSSDADYRRYTTEYRMLSARETGTSWRSVTARRWRLDQLRISSRTPLN